MRCVRLIAISSSSKLSLLSLIVSKKKLKYNEHISKIKAWRDKKLDCKINKKLFK